MKSVFPALGLELELPQADFTQIGYVSSLTGTQAKLIELVADRYGCDAEWTERMKYVFGRPQSHTQRGACIGIPVDGRTALFAYHTESAEAARTFIEGHEETHALDSTGSLEALARLLPQPAADALTVHQSFGRGSHEGREIVADIGGIYAVDRAGKLEQCVRQVAWTQTFQRALLLYAGARRAQHLYEINRFSL